jgi:hypothetical protein
MFEMHAGISKQTKNHAKAYDTYSNFQFQDTVRYSNKSQK